LMMSPCILVFCQLAFGTRQFQWLSSHLRGEGVVDASFRSPPAAQNAPAAI
jgi:hypothetical protein